MSDKQYSISVIIPVFNEISLLENSISNINSFLSKHFGDYEIIIIESGSTDGSGEVCDKIARSLQNIKVIHEGARNGFGNALRIGYKNAVKDLVWLVTVDIPFPMEAILRAIPLFSKVDCVLSYRSKDNRSLGLRIKSFVYNNLTKLLLGLKVRHINSAFKVFKKEIIKSMPLISTGWVIDAEILYRIKKQKISYKEIPVEVCKRTQGKSSISLLSTFAILKELFIIAAKK